MSSSTLTPAEVAVALVEQAVAKHNTRLDKTFFKAVSSKYIHLLFNISFLLSGSCWCYAVLRWPVGSHHQWWLCRPDSFEPRNCQGPWWFCISCRSRYVGVNVLSTIRLWLNRRISPQDRAPGSWPAHEQSYGRQFSVVHFSPFIDMRLIDFPHGCIEKSNSLVGRSPQLDCWWVPPKRLIHIILSISSCQYFSEILLAVYSLQPSFPNVSWCSFARTISYWLTFPDDGLMVDDPYASYVRAFAMWVTFILIWKSHRLNNPRLSTKAITPGWYQIFLRGIGCNWLVCIAVWVRILQCCSEPLLTRRYLARSWGQRNFFENYCYLVPRLGW